MVVAAGSAELGDEVTFVELEIQIDYWAVSVGTFDPGKVVALIKLAFPETVVDPIDHSTAEVDRVAKFFEHMPEPETETVIRQIKRKAQNNGPTFRFEIPTDLGPIQGFARRYSVGLDLPDDTSDELRGRLEAFLKGLKLGEFEWKSTSSF